MSKIIEIHRFFNRLELSQDDPEVQAWFGQSFRAIGPYFEPGGKAVATGISMEVQRLLMPEILGMEKEDKDYRKSVHDYFHSLVTNVPKNGLKLEVGLEDDTQPISASNPPLNAKDYIIYQHAVKHPNVASDRSNAELDPTKKFYIHDPNKVATDNVKVNALEDEAMGLYFKYKDDQIKLDQILTVMGKSIHKLKPEDKVLELKKFAQKNPALNERDQKESFNKFISVCNDKSLEMKFLIQELIGAQYLEKVGTAVLIKESGEKLGDDLKEAVMYLSNPKHSKTLNILKANYDTKIKKGYFSQKEKIEIEKETE